jgi:hypothetical protein
MGRKPIRGWEKGAMTGAERQARRRERLRKNAAIDGLVEHVDKVLKQANTLTEQNWLVDQLAALIKPYQDDRERMSRVGKKARKPARPRR